MSWVQMTSKVGLVLTLLVFTGCSSSKSTSQSDEKDEPMSLRQHMERISGIRLSGFRENTKVQVRGRSSLTQTGYTQPLYVVDGNKMGRAFYFVASKLQPGVIESVKYMRGAGANRYGSEGSQGVVVIKTNTGD